MEGAGTGSPFERLHATGLLIQGFLAAILMTAVVQLVPGLKSESSTTPASLALFYAGLALVLAIRIPMAKLDVDRLFGPFPPPQTRPLIVVALPLAALSVGGFWLFFFPLSFVAPTFVQRWAIEGPQALDATTLDAWAAQAFVAVILAPILEEILFRGLLLHRWALKWGTTTGVVLSSAVFAIGHFELAGHFLFGLAMSALYLRTRSLWMPILAHALNNALVAALTLPDVLASKAEPAMTLETFRSQWWIGALALGAGVIMLESYRRRYWSGVDIRALFRGPAPYTALG